MPIRKHTIILLGIFFSSLQLYAQASVELKMSADTLKNSFGPLLKPNLSDSLINYGKLYLNTPYRYGSGGTAHFDCSGFTSHVFRNFGYNLQRSSADQANQFPEIAKSQLQPGDLVFFNGRRRNGRVGHVGIVVSAKEDGDFDFIHASVKSGVIISNSKEDYYLKRFVRAGRVLGVDSFPQLAFDNTKVSLHEPEQKIEYKKVTKVVPAKYHYVKSGENLSVIADRYGVSVTKLKKKNHLKSEQLQVKQRLKIEDEKEISVVEKVLVENTKKHSKDSTIAQNSLTKSVADVKTTHKVQKGETLFTLSKLYGKSIDELRALNNLKDAKIVIGQEIIVEKPVEIAQHVSAVKPNVAVAEKEETTYKVTKGETLSSIARKFDTTQDELISLNQLASNKILAGQELKVAVQKTAVASSAVPAAASGTEQPASINEPVSHKVAAGESLFSISKLYNISIDELKAHNNLSTNKLQQGQTLQIPGNASSVTTITVTKAKSTPAYAFHKVRSGETLSSIALKYNCSINDIKKWNKKSSDKLSLGDKLKIQSN
ncbi:MAG: LysM peptidoglycan-binding domain-containing protein [Paludibacter sp.]|nr:LysM peptidoglycan-binding domain-containing protein [Paludibacter sp.]